MAANVFLKSVAMFARCSSSKLVMLARQVLLHAPDVSVSFFFGCFVDLDIVNKVTQSSSKVLKVGNPQGGEGIIKIGV